LIIVFAVVLFGAHYLVNFAGPKMKLVYAGIATVVFAVLIVTNYDPIKRYGWVIIGVLVTTSLIKRVKEYKADNHTLGDGLRDHS